MNLKFAIMLLITALLAEIKGRASEMPLFSNDETDHWYYIVFSCGDAVMADRGTNIGLRTAIPDGKNQSQQWMLIGDSDNFTLVSHSGRYAVFNGVMRISENASDASSFRLVETENSTYTGD